LIAGAIDSQPHPDCYRGHMSSAKPQSHPFPAQEFTAAAAHRRD
jgi:hypothetical protein